MARRLFELLADVVSDKLSVEIRTADFFDVDVHGHTDHLLNFCLEHFDVSTLLADHDTGTSREDRDASIVGRTFDQNARDAGVLQLFTKESTDAEVFAERAGKVTADRIPARRPVARNGKAEAGRINFLTHGSPFTCRRRSRRCEPSACRYAYRDPWREHQSGAASWPFPRRSS